MPELGKAYVQIVPSAQGISGSISSALSGEANDAGSSAGSSLGGSLISALKGVIVAAGIGTMIKESLNAGGDLQQSFGGLETIYGDAAEAAKKYAAEAQKAGISANDYAENAVSFGASLKQAFEGDTAKAVEAANTAILDMTDNAAKMGTPIESIQTAYQGFAKQNYTMLDNLKLGYGGTKQEMERLLEDAQKISGVEYNMDNLGDVYEAIHVIQGDLGLTGVAAQEASETFSGSFGAMKAAAENLMANMALGENIQPSLKALGESVNAFVFNNLLPMLGNIVSAIPDVISGVGKMIIQGLNIAQQNAGEVAKVGIDIMTSLAMAIFNALPYLAEGAFSIAKAFGEALFNADWISIGKKLMDELKSSIDLMSEEILGNDTLTVDSIIDGIMSGLSNLQSAGADILDSVYDGITTTLPTILSAGSNIVMSVIDGIVKGLPSLLSGATQIVTSFAAFIVQNAPMILSAGTELVAKIVSGISSVLPNILSTGLEIINTLLKGITSLLPTVLQSGVSILTTVVNGIVSNIPQLISTAIQLVTQFATFILQNLPTILKAGADLILELVKGITNNFPEIVMAAAKGITEFLTKITSMLPDVLKQGIEIIGKLVAGLIQAIPKIIAAIPQIISGIKDTLLQYDWLGLGKDIVTGIAEGISNAGSSILSALWGAVESAISWVKDKLSIESPSKYMANNVGKWMALGIGVGFDDNMPKNAMVDSVLDTTNAMTQVTQSGIDLGSPAIDYQMIYEAVKAGASAANVELYFDNREVARSLRDIGVAVG